MSEKARVLFIGEMISSHAQSWVSLLLPHADFDVRALNISPWSTWENAPIPVDTPTIQDGSAAGGESALVHEFAPRLWNHYIPPEQILDARVLAAARRRCEEFCPHVVHTFGFFPSAVFYAELMRNALPDWKAKWVLQTRGGSDFATPYTDEAWTSFYRKIMEGADAVVCDNERNFQILESIGVAVRRHPALSIAPGTGGMPDGKPVETDMSRQERIIIWPKAYDCPFSKNLPVLEGLRTALERTRPAKIICVGMNQEAREWLERFPPPLRECFELHDCYPREQFLALLGRARVMLAPTLVDGIPNVLYEAMSAGMIPIISPLETVTPHFTDGIQVLYARNLYPNEIADALVKALDDDELAGRIVRHNAEHFPFFARRPDIERRVRELYLDLAGKIDPAWTPLGQARSGLQKNRAELDAARAELSAMRSELDVMRPELDTARSELDALRTVMQSELNAARAELSATRAELDTARAGLDAARSELDAMRSALDAANRIITHPAIQFQLWLRRKIKWRK